jgi:hypothetical protein
MGPAEATSAEIAAWIEGRYRGRAAPGQLDIFATPDGSRGARPGNHLGHGDMVHFLAAVRQVRRDYPTLRE